MDTSMWKCGHMADVGVRELKRRLSAYLDRAERGEVLRVTDRGRPKAVLGPLPGRVRIEDGIRSGWIAPGTGAPLGPVHRSQAARPVLVGLAEDRGE
ncbi:MAG: type II toxin-antitoxin system Phd/YefM family antitoxin [Candidatus Limnocylindrales bacterium]